MVIPEQEAPYVDRSEVAGARVSADFCNRRLRPNRTRSPPVVGSPSPCSRLHSVSRVLYYLLGVRFDAAPLGFYRQCIDPELLRVAFWQSLQVSAARLSPIRGFRCSLFHRVPFHRGPLRDRGGQVSHPHQVVDRGREGKHPSDAPASAVARLAHQPHGLEPPEDLLDPLPFQLLQASGP